MESLVINQCFFFHILAGALICKFLSIPDWLKFRRVKQVCFTIGADPDEMPHDAATSGSILFAKVTV